MDRLPLAKKKSSSNLRKRSISATSATPSDQKPREEKSAPYRDQRYETLLEVNGSYMTKAPLGVARASQTVCRSLLETTPPVPSDTLFRDDVFETTKFKWSSLYFNFLALLLILASCVPKSR